jgi:hypothetical protein
MLRRSGSVDEFTKRFMALSCRDMTITEPQQIHIFITGLGDPLRLDVVLQQPSSMDDAVIFARAFEQRLVSQQPALEQTRGSGHAQPPTVHAVASTGTKPPPVVKRLMATEIAERRKDGRCFHCDEFFYE